MSSGAPLSLLEIIQAYPLLHENLAENRLSFPSAPRWVRHSYLSKGLRLIPYTCGSPGSMYENKVWTLVELPNDRQAIENKWIFKKKTHADSSVTIYKARIVAKGFRQVQGVDYDEIFSLVSMLKSLSKSC